MIECPIYYTLPGDTGVASPPPDDETSCTGCNCGYLQFEDTLEYLKEIRDALRQDSSTYNELEFKLRSNIIEVSRLFDIEAGVRPGYFSKAHYTTTKIIATNGTQYLKIPPFVKDTLEVRNMSDIVLDASTYGVKDSHLVYLPCVKHGICGCTSDCGGVKSVEPIVWPPGCYKITAKWGSEVADAAVQKAIRDYLIESYRMQDPVVVLANGLQVQRTFKVPHSWTTYIQNFKAKRKIFSGFAIA
jgi:hypothetical protein